MATPPIDVRSFGPKGPPGQPDATQLGYWWRAKQDTLHEAVFAVIKHLRTNQNARLAELARNVRLYGDREGYGSVQNGWPRPRLRASGGPLDKARITFNVIRMATDTLAAKIAKNRPKPTCVTDGGNWSQQRRAKNLDKFLQGVFYECRIPEKGAEGFLDAAIEDIGVIKFFRRSGRICAERTFPSELFVDEADGIYGEPRSMYQVKSIPREVLYQLFPRQGLREVIRTAATPETLAAGAPRPTQALADYALVVEAWHLPSGPDADDGKHVIALSSGALLVEKWTRPRFPFAFFRYSKRRVGFFGQGVAEQLLGVQLSVNKKLKTINAILHLCAVPRYYVEETSDVVSSHLSNEIGAIVKYRGVAPQLAVQNTVPPELFSELERDKARAFELVGVSQMSVAAMKPAGLNSQPALREFDDINSERFSLTGQAYEQFHLDMAEVIIDEAEEAHDEGEDLQVRLPRKGGVDQISWKDVRLDREAFVMKMFPTSSLPQTPAARKQTVAEWQQAGWIDGTEARRLLDFPDLEASNNLAFAAAEDIDATIEDLLDAKGYQPPEPHQDLAYGVKRMQSAYLRAKRSGAPDAVLESMITWMDQAQEQLEKVQAALAPPPGAPGIPGAPPSLPPPPVGVPR